MSTPKKSTTKRNKDTFRKIVQWLKRHEKSIIVTILALATVFRVLLALNTPINIWPEQVYDDNLMQEYALNIRGGNWLGEYNQLTLTKGITFSVFMAVCNFLLIPYNLGLVLLWILAVFVVCQAFKPKFGVKSRALLYILLLFAPCMFTTLISQRLYRNALLPAGTLLIFGSFIGLYLRRNKNIKTLIPWSISAAVSLASYWFIKEDSIWVLPFIVVISILCLIFWVRKWFILRKLKKEAKELLWPKFLLLFAPYIFLIVVSVAYSFINYQSYGVFTTSDKSSGNFAKMIKSMMIIDDPNRQGTDVWITKNMFEKIYDNSPTFENLKEEVSEIKSWTNDSGESLGDLVIWKIRLAMSNKGYYKDAKQADDFSKKVADELSDAFNDGRLTKDSKIHISAQMRGMDFEDIINGLGKQAEWFWLLSVYDDTGINNYRSSGDAARLRQIGNFTNSLYVPAESEYRDIKAINYSNGIVKIYQKLSMVVNILSGISLVIALIILVRRIIQKDYKDFDLVAAWLGIALSVLLLLMEVSLFLGYLDDEAINTFRNFYCASATPLLQLLKYIPILFVTKEGWSYLSIKKMLKTGKNK